MKRIILACTWTFISIMICSGQEKEIRATVDRMFQSMYSRDTSTMRLCFLPGAKLLTYSSGMGGKQSVHEETLNDIIHGVAGIGDAIMEERLVSWQCLIDDGIASVWTPYEFYFKGQFSHCGVNSFQLVKVEEEWKISMITDTRRKSQCPGANKEVVKIDSLVNAWHHAAAIADETTFFGSMTEDGIYIGTDASERWLRDELAEWSKKYFDRDVAWNFTPLSRNIKIGPGGQIAWFDELLDTWMGPCRSTGIVLLQDGEWKIAHYQLSAAVPNDKINEYKKLIGKE
ncbi:MAG TPA: nuclear transport factor 2 family protein [Saprospiraceae bacterium]|nr:nuclear transport factor 2 family protein [Saprospiraceae bacterium]